MKTRKKIILPTLLTALCFFIFSPAYAQEVITNPKTDAFKNAKDNLNIIGGITGFGDIKGNEQLGVYDKIASVINILLGFAGIIAVIYIIFAGFKWMTAQGNEEQITSAKGTIKNAVIGLGIVLLAFVIVNFVTKSLIDVVQGPPPAPAPAP
ncbi:pilin [Patescibacteria group bacterium]|nr:pilin [Patescibacteria group bacterium]